MCTYASFVFHVVQKQLLQAAKSGLADNLLEALAEGAHIEFASTSEVRESLICNMLLKHVCTGIYT